MRGLVIAFGIASAAVSPADAQRAAGEIALVEAAAPAGAVVLGEVRAEIHQKSLFAKTPARDLVDKELRVQASKLGADAVVDIRYEGSSPLLSRKGFTAVGKAVRFASPSVQVVAAPPPSPQPNPEPGRIAAIAPATPAAVAAPPAPPAVPVVPPVQPAVLPPPVEVITPAPQPVAPVAQAAAPAAAAPEVTAAIPPPPVEPAVAQPAPPVVATAPAVPRGPTPEALIVLTEEDLAGRAYDRLGEVKAEARQNSLFPKKSARVLMDEQLRAKAAALGADAVILIRYESYAPLISKRGSSATGIAVKYR